MAAAVAEGNPAFEPSFSLFSLSSTSCSAIKCVISFEKKSSILCRQGRARPTATPTRDKVQMIVHMKVHATHCAHEPDPLFEMVSDQRSLRIAGVEIEVKDPVGKGAAVFNPELLFSLNPLLFSSSLFILSGLHTCCSGRGRRLLDHRCARRSLNTFGAVIGEGLSGLGRKGTLDCGGGLLEGGPAWGYGHAGVVLLRSCG